tara:strand:+ start:3583 stop:3942 length:360 start_codon:yes stop_codon:yes gene_type:complete
MTGNELAQAVFSRVDAMDAQGFASYLTADSKFVFGSWPAAEGPEAAAQAVGDFFGGIDGISHEIQDVWENGDTVSVRLAVTYTRKDGTSVTLPCANIWKCEGGKISDYRIYMDVNPVFA